MKAAGREYWRARRFVWLGVLLASVLTACVSEGEAGGGGGSGTQSTKTKTLPTAAGLTVSPISPIVTQDTTFTLNCAGGTGALRYEWDFGDGSTSTLPRPTHAYTSAKQYDVKLRCIDQLGNEARAGTQLTVLANIPPVVKLRMSPPGAKPIGEVLVFSADASSPTGDLLTYSWDFGDGSTKITGTDKSSVTHKYATSGTYTARLTVSDQHGGQTLASVTVGAGIPVFTEQPPTRQTMRRDKAIAFSAMAVEAAEIITLSWDFGDGSPVVNGQTASHAYRANGTYTVTVTAADTHGGTSQVTSLVDIVDNRPPIAPKINVPAHIDWNMQPTSLSATTASAFGDPLTYSWDFGDGSTSTQASPTHRYAAVGSYTITVTATDALGLSARSSTTVVVGNFQSVSSYSCTGASPGEGWCFQNPLPTASIVNQIKMVNSRQGWAVGSAGMIIHTVDGGSNWVGQPSGVTEAIRSIHAIDVYRAFAVGDQGTVLKTVDAGKTWRSLSAGTTQNLQSVYAADESNVWAVGDAGTVIKTSDGGANWRTAPVPGVTTNLYAITGMRGDRIWLAGEGIFARTDNLGADWSVLASTTYKYLSALSVNDIVVAGVNARPTLAISRDGGSSSALILPLSDFNIAPLRSMSVTLGEVIWLSGLDSLSGYERVVAINLSGQILGAVNGTTFRQEDKQGLWSHVAAVSDKVAVLIGIDFPLSITVDGGNTIRTLAGSFGSDDLYEVAAASDNVAWVRSGNSVFKTTNGGVSWRAANLSPAASLRINVSSANDVWQGSYRSIDGGSSWSKVDAGFAVDEVVPVNASILWAYSKNTTSVSNDGGITWSTARSAPLRDLDNNSRSKLFPVSRNVAWYLHRPHRQSNQTATEPYVACTRDAGVTWLAYGDCVRFYGTVMDIAPISEDVVWIAQSGGSVSKTMDGGQTWSTFKPNPNSSTMRFMAVAAINENTAYVLAQSGEVYKTTDGGVHWTYQNTRATRDMHGISAAGANNLWAVGTGGKVIHTVTGGE